MWWWPLAKNAKKPLRSFIRFIYLHFSIKKKRFKKHSEPIKNTFSTPTNTLTIFHQKNNITAASSSKNLRDIDRVKKLKKSLSREKVGLKIVMI